MAPCNNSIAVFAVLGFLALAATLGWTIPSASSLAQTPSSLKQIEFSKQTDNYLARRKAERLFDSYIDRNRSLPGQEDTPTFARYLPLGDGPRDFIGLYRQSGIGGSCPQLGCELIVFHNYQGDDWRVVMDVYTHELWVGASTANTPPDVYLRSHRPPWQEEYSERAMGRWKWKDGSYRFEEVYEP